MKKQLIICLIVMMSGCFTTQKQVLAKVKIKNPNEKSDKKKVDDINKSSKNLDNIEKVNLDENEIIINRIKSIIGNFSTSDKDISITFDRNKKEKIKPVQVKYFLRKKTKTQIVEISLNLKVENGKPSYHIYIVVKSLKNSDLAIEKTRIKTSDSTDLMRQVENSLSESIIK